MTAQQAFDDHHKAVYRFVYRLVGRPDWAEDITQDCFLTLLREPQRPSSARGDLRTFLFAVARNLAFKRYRDEHTALQREEASAASMVEERADLEISMLVAQTIAQLPELQREALILFEYEGFELSEIAEIVGADIGVVKSRLHRARQTLKRLLAPYRKVGTHENVCR